MKSRTYMTPAEILQECGQIWNTFPHITFFWPLSVAEQRILTLHTNISIKRQRTSSCSLKIACAAAPSSYRFLFHLLANKGNVKGPLQEKYQ